MIDQGWKRRGPAVGAVVLVVMVVVGFGVARMRDTTAPLGRCRQGTIDDWAGAPGLIAAAGELRTVASWSPEGPPADPPTDNTVRATASFGPWGSDERTEETATAHAAMSDDLVAALDRRYRVVAGTLDITAAPAGYVELAVGITPDGEVEFLGECSELITRWFTATARDLGTSPELLLVDFLDHRGSSALDDVLSSGG